MNDSWKHPWCIVRATGSYLVSELIYVTSIYILTSLLRKLFIIDKNHVMQSIVFKVLLILSNLFERSVEKNISWQFSLFCILYLKNKSLWYFLDFPKLFYSSKSVCPGFLLLDNWPALQCFQVQTPEGKQMLQNEKM